MIGMGVMVRLAVGRGSGAGVVVSSRVLAVMVTVGASPGAVVASAVDVCSLVMVVRAWRGMVMMGAELAEPWGPGVADGTGGVMCPDLSGQPSK